MYYLLIITALYLLANWPLARKFYNDFKPHRTRWQLFKSVSGLMLAGLPMAIYFIWKNRKASPGGTNN